MSFLILEYSQNTLDYEGIYLTDNSKNLLEFNKVSKKYGQKIALDGLDLQVKSAERVALLGVNGAGKSTLLSLATGIREVSSGQVRLLGGDPRNARSRRGLGYLPQAAGFPPFLKVSEVIATVSSHFTETNMELIDLLGVREIWNSYVGSLSGGQNRRVALVCSLISQPTLALLDEPTAGMDIAMRTRTFELLNEYFRHSERSVLFSTHHMDEVEKLADRVVVINKGLIIEEGSVKQIKQKYGLRGLYFTSELESLSLDSASVCHKEDGQWRAYGTNMDDLLKELVTKIPDARNIVMKEPNLEEVFLTLTKGSL